MDKEMNPKTKKMETETSGSSSENKRADSAEIKTDPWDELMFGKRREASESADQNGKEDNDAEQDDDAEKPDVFSWI